MFRENFGLNLVITDPVVGYERCCEAAVRAGVALVQLRMKRVSRETYVATARALCAITRGTSTALVVNDDPAVAAEAGADGVHVGQGDLSVSEVRRRWPALRIVGLSVHERAHLAGFRRDAAADVCGDAPDYIGIGPVFPTSTKPDADPALGVAATAELARLSSVPSVAIGGVNARTLPALRAAGLRNWAVVSAICASRDPYAAIRELQEVGGGASWKG